MSYKTKDLKSILNSLEDDIQALIDKYVEIMKDAAYKDGYDKGKGDGYDEGFNDGKEEGKEEAEENFKKKEKVVFT
jgi:flagellar biosynthesis/type III secretory pathway protein FliH